MKSKIKILIILFLLITAVSTYIFYNDIRYSVQYAFLTKNDLVLSLESLDAQIKSISCDPDNKLYLKAEVKDRNGRPVPRAKVSLWISKGTGQLDNANIRMNSNGQSIFAYSPPNIYDKQVLAQNSSVTVTAKINGSDKAVTVPITLSPVPIVLVHGYRSDHNVFASLIDYLKRNGYDANYFDYNSTNGIIDSAQQLGVFLNKLKNTYLNKGISINKFNVITHSMGGLVTRYYSCSDDYAQDNTIKKIIFISCPHKGSSWASLVSGYYSDRGIKDLMPDSKIFSQILPSLRNKGLNESIEVGNILGLYDEVVTLESNNLKDWGIDTKVFDVGESSFSVDKLFDGRILEQANHNIILNNKKVFEEISKMLNQRLPTPQKR